MKAKNLLLLFPGLLAVACSRQSVPLSYIPTNTRDLRIEADTQEYILSSPVPEMSYIPKIQHDSAWYYEQAFKELDYMLTDQIPINFKRAVFVTENAYLNNAVDYNAFKNLIAYDTAVCNGIESYSRLKNYHHWKDSAAILKNEAIFSFMSKNILLGKKLPVQFSTPFGYNFSDCFGDSDWTNSFVLKTLLIHKGNCRSLTFLYKILADELGTNASLALAPNHIYIKQRSDKLVSYNTELTSGLNPIDGWIMAANYISLESVQKGVYMKALTDKENIAVCLVDLAEGYKHKFKNDTAQFILRCTDLALRYNPKYIDALQLKGRTFKKIYDLTKSKTAYKKMDSAYVAIVNLGYQEMPEWEYRQWLQEMDKEKEKYTAKKTDPTGANPGMYYGYDDKQAAIKHNPYKSLGFKPPKVISLSGGKYEEFFDYNDLVAIDDVVISRKKSRIVKMVDKELRPEGITRWMSPDPLAQKFPSVSPYMSFGDNPIVYVDPDGRDNVIYLVVLPSAYKEGKMTEADIKKMVADANANFRLLGINTTVVLFNDKLSGGKAFDKKNMDKTDAVAILGETESVKNYIKDNKLTSTNTNMSSELQPGQVGWQDNDGSTPETSEGGGDPGRGDVIAIDAVEAKKDLGNGDYSATLINHGAGHNAGLDHILTRDKNGKIIPQVMLAGTDLATYVNEGKNNSVIDEFQKKNNGSYIKAVNKRFQPNNQKSTVNYGKKREGQK